MEKEELQHLDEYLKQRSQLKGRIEALDRLIVTLEEKQDNE